jgi:hypothetical protein
MITQQVSSSVKLLTCNQQVTCSNLGQTIVVDILCRFTQSFQENLEALSYVGSLPHPSTLSPVHYSPPSIHLPLHEVLTVLDEPQMNNEQSDVDRHIRWKGERRKYLKTCHGSIERRIDIKARDVSLTSLPSSRLSYTAWRGSLHTSQY